MAYSIRCPVCRKKFPWAPVEGFPDECPNVECNSRIGIEDETVIVMPSIRSARMAATDKVYRDIEKGSEVRAQAAAEMTGATAAEMSDIKITDLRPTTHQGDVAAPKLPTHLQNFGSFGGGQAAEFSSAVQAGPYPNAGARSRTSIQNMHPEMVARHCVGKSETGQMVAPSTNVTSDRPALETQQPGYRIRG